MLKLPTRLAVTENGDNLKFEWSTQRHILTPYSVNAARVQRAGDKVRDKLRAIAERYRAGSACYDERDLQELAAAGRVLFDCLFSVSGGDSTSAEYLKAEIESKLDRIDLTVFSDGNVAIPWGFVFRHQPSAIKHATNSIADFDGFFSSIFRISIRFHRMQPPCDDSLPRSTLKTLFALHKDSFNNARRLLSPSYASLLARLDRLMQNDVGYCTDWKACKVKWDAISDCNSIVYLFGHSDGISLALADEVGGNRLSNEYRIETDELVSVFLKPKNNRSNTVYFINGCRTACGSMGDGFLSATSGPGCHGFIGCESEITNDFATQYAAEFLDLLCEGGKSIAECFEELRNRLFPLSLWYSCYADPEFRIADDRAGQPC